MQNFYKKITDGENESLTAFQKRQIMISAQKNLCKQHYNKFPSYKNIIDSLGINLDYISTLTEIPYLPARLFKYCEFYDGTEKIIIESSGTTGTKSHIGLNTSDIKMQKKSLFKIAKDYIGEERRPVVFFTGAEAGNVMSAKSAGVLGFNIFATQSLYMSQSDPIEKFIEFAHKYSSKILIYGTTIDIYTRLIRPYRSRVENLENTVIVMGGGWKNSSITLSQSQMKESIKAIWNISRMFDFYGMTEQIGSVDFSCEQGFYHCNDFTDIIVRDPITLKEIENGREGLIQVLSMLPISYPGNSVLTEDIGLILGEDCCKCGRKGKIFKILGRAAMAESKGCAYGK